MISLSLSQSVIFFHCIFSPCPAEEIEWASSLLANQGQPTTPSIFKINFSLDIWPLTESELLSITFSFRKSVSLYKLTFINKYLPQRSISKQLILFFLFVFWGTSNVQNVQVMDFVLRSVLVNLLQNITEAKSKFQQKIHHWKIPFCFFSRVVKFWVS